MKKIILTITECAIMLALAIALSFVKLWEMPLGGSVTLVSMLPIFLISIKYGLGTGLGTAFVYSLFQLLQAVMQGDVFIYYQTAFIVVICALFDYVVPFSVLGLSGVFARKTKFGAYAGLVAVTVARFVCHFVTGVFIWGQWAPEGMGKVVYSIVYNGGFLLPDLAICIAVAIPLLQVKQMRKLLGLTDSK